MKSSIGEINKYTVTVYHTPVSTACDILTFGPAGNRAVIDGTNITWTVPFGTPLAPLAPEYTVSQYFGGSATGSPLSGTAPDFSTNNPATYTILAQDGFTSKTYHVTVNFYPEWPTLVNVNYSGDSATASMDGIYSFDATAKGSASRVGPGGLRRE